MLTGLLPTWQPESQVKLKIFKVSEKSGNHKKSFKFCEKAGGYEKNQDY